MADKKDTTEQESDPKTSGAKDSDSKAKDKATSKKTKKSDSDKAAAKRAKAPGAKRWPAPTMATLIVVGVLWMVVFYVTTSSGVDVPLMSQLGYWNLAIGMGFLAAGLVIATQWE